MIRCGVFPFKKRGARMGVRGRYARDLVQAAEDAGGEVSTTSNGHLQVKGPKGIAVVGSDGSSRRAAKNARRDIRLHAGLEVVVKS